MSGVLKPEACDPPEWPQEVVLLPLIRALNLWPPVRRWYCHRPMTPAGDRKVWRLVCLKVFIFNLPEKWCCDILLLIETRKPGRNKFVRQSWPGFKTVHRPPCYVSVSLPDGEKLAASPCIPWSSPPPPPPRPSPPSSFNVLRHLRLWGLRHRWGQQAGTGEGKKAWGQRSMVMLNSNAILEQVLRSVGRENQWA